MAEIVAAIDRTVGTGEWQRLTGGEGEWLWISSSERYGNEQREAVARVCAAWEPAAVGVWFKRSDDDAQRLLDRLPLWLRLMTAPSRWEGLLVHRETLRRVPVVGQGSEPAVEWLVASALGGIAMRELPMQEIGSPACGAKSHALPVLAPVSPPRSWMKPLLARFQPEKVGAAVRSSVDMTALKAGLYQVHGFLDESHQCSQSIEGAGRHRHGDYWHAIMHRREPDYSNSKYWFRHVGRHPIFGELAEVHSRQLKRIDDANLVSRLSQLVDGRGEWDPFAFVDFCRQCAESNRPEWTIVAEEIQWFEMLLLLKATVDDALVMD